MHLLKKNNNNNKVRSFLYILMRYSYCQAVYRFYYPFDGLTPLRGEWDEYFLLSVP
jgi:hypothetical protein